MIRYSNEDFIGTMDTTPGFLMWKVNSRTYPNEGDVGALSLMNKLLSEAPYSESMFAIKEGPWITHLLFYMGQCSLLEIQEGCQEKVGWRVLGPNRNIRYERYRFYDEVSAWVS